MIQISRNFPQAVIPSKYEKYSAQIFSSTKFPLQLRDSNLFLLIRKKTKNGRKTFHLQTKKLPTTNSFAGVEKQNYDTLYLHN